MRICRFARIASSICCPAHHISMSLPSNQNLLAWFLWIRINVSILGHPKGHKLVMRACELNEPLFCRQEKKIIPFHVVCRAIMDIVRNIGPRNPRTWQYTLWITYCHLSFLVLSVKHWDKDQIRHFAQNHWVQLKEVLDGILQFSEYTLPRGIVGLGKLSHRNAVFRLKMVPTCMKYVLLKIQSAMRSERIDALVRRCKWFNYFIGQNDDVRRSVASDLRASVTCANHGCCVKQSDSAPFKICSGCKIAYFCSKRCQKEAWTAHHRQICKILTRKYSL